tara:strand:- start:191471 stop:192226 length:756 start_codon:yes stop_codon:yes gene_type:complete
MKTLHSSLALKGLLLALSLSLYSCGGSGDDERTSAPSITILSPADSLNLSNNKVPVEILFSDNSGLVSTEITIGNTDLGNIVYHYSQRGLSGLNDNLQFEAAIPPTINAAGENYIIVQCFDEDGNETFVEQTFYFLNQDNSAPIINTIAHQGILTRDPQASMSIAYDLRDDQGLDSLYIYFMKSQNGNLLGDTLVAQGIKLNGEKNRQGIAYFTGSPSYPGGSSYKVLAKAFDLGGNSRQYISPAEYSIPN